MRDHRLNVAERRLQHWFSKLLITGVFLLLVSDSRLEWPDRESMPERLALLRFEPLSLSDDAGPGVTVTGAWKVSADDPRFGGLSGLAVLDGAMLLAVTDSGVLIDLPKPGARPVARLRDLMGGPGYPTFKKYRDAEALRLRRDPIAPETNSLEISFEQRHSLFEFSREGRLLGRTNLPGADWPDNKGVEALTLDGEDNLLLIPEGGRQVLTGRPDQLTRKPLAGAKGGIAEAVRFPGGRIVVAIREVGVTGLTNRLAWLEREGAGYRLTPFATLPLGLLDNVEGLAAEPAPGGGTVLWAVTDNDGWRRTLLLRMMIKNDVSAEAETPGR